MTLVLSYKTLWGLIPRLSYAHGALRERQSLPRLDFLHAVIRVVEPESPHSLSSLHLKDIWSGMPDIGQITLVLVSAQLARLMECENVLVALELSNFLNDANYALQAVTQCYGLLAPIIYHNIVLVPVIQVRVSRSLHRRCVYNERSVIIMGKMSHMTP